MKINSTGFNKIQFYQNQLKIAENQQFKQKKEDQVEISSQAKDLQSASKILSDREERVQQLKQQVQEGSYEINPSTIAEKMINYFSKK
jgi:negative regulator of flagellin synthesis FlgM